MAVAAIAALSSCSSDNEVFNSEAKKALTFTATMENIGGDTRATFNATDKCAEWEVGDDKIYIIGVDASNNATEASYVASGTNGTSTTFEPATQGQEVSGQTFRAFFPTYIAAGSIPEIPHEIEEIWAEGKFNMPMYAMSNTTTLAFQNLCGVLAIKVNKDQLEKVEFITISSSNRKLNGMIQPMPNNEGKLSVGLVSPAKDDNFDDLAIHYTSVVEIGEEGNVFYVPIPPSYNFDRQTMSFTADPYKDLKILLNDGEGHIKTMTTKKDADILVERNKIYNITFKDNSYPAGSRGTAKATIGGSEVDVNWVQLWEDGPKFAEHATEEIYTWAEATMTGDEFVWGAKWCTPSKDEMMELHLAADQKTSKVSCVYDTSKKEFIFTGKDKYANNSLVLPTEWIGSNYIFMSWTSTESANSTSKAYAFCPYSIYGGATHWGKWEEYDKTKGAFKILPILYETK